MYDGFEKALRNPCLPCLLLGNPTRIPEPDRGVTYLGTMLELLHELPDGSEVRHAWSTRRAPPLFWSEKRRALYCFPGMRLPAKVKRGTHGHAAAADAYRRWTGREPRGHRKTKAPRAIAAQAGEAYYILYRSDRREGKLVNYVHPFEGGVQAVLGPGKPPSVFMVSGGRLRLTKWGLEG